MLLHFYFFCTVGRKRSAQPSPPSPGGAPTLYDRSANEPALRSVLQQLGLPYRQASFDSPSPTSAAASDASSSTSTCSISASPTASSTPLSDTSAASIASFRYHVFSSMTPATDRSSSSSSFAAASSERNSSDESEAELTAPPCKRSKNSAALNNA